MSEVPLYWSIALSPDLDVFDAKPRLAEGERGLVFSSSLLLASHLRLEMRVFEHYGCCICTIHGRVMVTYLKEFIEACDLATCK